MRGLAGAKAKWVSLGLATVVVSGAQLAHAAPELTVAPLQLLDVAATLKESAGFKPASAFDGSEWLVVYLDRGVGAGRLSGTWVDADGNASVPFSLGRGSADTDANLVFDGEAFIAAWHGGYLDDGFYAQRITKAGPGPLIRATLPSTGTLWVSDVAVDGAGQAHFITCTGDSAEPWDCVTYRLVDDQLQEQATFEHPAMHSLDLELSDAGAIAGAWTNSGVALLRMSADDELLETLSLSATGTSPSVVRHDDGFAMEWGDGPQAGVAVLDAEGEVLSSALVETEHTLFGLPSDIIGAPPPDRANLFDAKLVAVADGYLLFASASRACDGPCGYPLVVKPLSSELEAVGGPPLQLAEEAAWQHPDFSVATGAADVLLSATIVDTSVGSVGLRARMLDPQSLTASPRHDLAHTVSEQDWPLSAPGGEGWLLAWREDETQHAALLDDVGAVVHEISDLSPIGSFVDIAGSAEGWLAASVGGDDSLYATRIAVDGELSPSRLLGSGGHARILRSTDGWLVVWLRHEDREPTEPSQVSLVADRLTVGGVHQGSSLLATATWPDFVAAFDVIEETNGFSIIVTGPDGARTIRTNASAEPIGGPETFALPTTDVLSVQVVRTTTDVWTLWREKVDCTLDLCPCLDCLLWLGPLSDVDRFGLGKLSSVAPLRTVGERVVATLTDNDWFEAETHVVVADSSGPIMQAPPLSGLRKPFVSAARGDRLLLSAIAPTERYGARVDRVHLAFVEVGDASGTAGEGGTAGAAGGETEEPGVGGASAAGASSLNGGGQEADGGGQSPSHGGARESVGGEGTEAMAPRTPEAGCTCRLRPAQSSGSFCGALALLVLFSRQRRRRR